MALDELPLSLKARLIRTFFPLRSLGLTDTETIALWPKALRLARNRGYTDQELLDIAWGRA